MMLLGLVWALVPLVAWLVLMFGRGGFWLTRERDDHDAPAAPATWPSVVAVVPARDEAEGIVRSLTSLLRQDYPGAFRVILVDDQSRDGTAAIARRLNDARLAVLDGKVHPHGWTGKLFAVAQGVAEAGQSQPDYLWLTDADIEHAPDNLRRLAARAVGEGRVLVSLMAKLKCDSFAEKLLVPAFVLFFAMLYPFGWVNDARKKTAAAAGGCMLVKRAALEAAGGIEAIRGEIIDDCALGRLLKRQGPISLCLTNRSVSLRPYPHFSDIRKMVSRSAYAELDYSPLKLAGALCGLLLLYVLPLAGFCVGGLPALGGALSWAVMTLIAQPMLHFYHRSPFWGLILPLIGIVYAAFTLDSAIQHWRGRGGMWKGRAQAMEGK
jgi:hopene-associated glycosyltransferase HpnB